MKIPKIDIKPTTWDERWQEKAAAPPCPDGRRSSPCNDCPAEGMYFEFADSLRHQPRNIQKKCLDSWFCHTTTNKACAGAWQYVEQA